MSNINNTSLNNTTTTPATTHHGGVDGALAGGVLGHEHGTGHTARDAVVGAVAGHEAEAHHEGHHGHHHGHHGHHHDGAVGGAGVLGSSTTAPAHTSGVTGAHNTTTGTTASLGDKISGNVDVLVGKVTNNPAKVQEVSIVPGSKGRVLLAYSGGLDTSCILAYLIDEGYEVIAFMGDVGQEEDFDAAEKKAYKIGAKKFFLADLKREFVEHLIYPAVQANAIYEGVYLLGTSLARPVIARAMMDIVVREDCQFVSHGCTGKGNDQVRFELAFYALQPTIKVIAPWRDPIFYERFAGRGALLDYAAAKGIHVFQTAAKPWSTDENLFHISYEAGILEDPDVTPPADMWKLTQSLENTPKTAERITITFTKGIPTSLLIHPEGQSPVPSTEGKEITDSVEVFLALNALARKHGIGRCDIVENRFIGVKSRGCYESPAGTILRKAHMDLEGLTMDRNVRALRDGFVTIELSKILYNGYWFSPEREFVQSCLEKSQQTVNGRVRLALLCGNVIVEGRQSDTEALYDAEQSSMDVIGDFSPVATTGFIAIESIRVKKWGEARLKKGGTVKPESVYATAA